MSAAPGTRVPGGAPSAEPKEPVLSPAPRHRAPGTAPTGAVSSRARHAVGGSNQRRLFIVTALVCAALLIAVPLALYFSAPTGPGGGGGNGYGGQGGSGSAGGGGGGVP